ncbi:MAG: adenosylcobalamin-dependent ribonucleoside-diphosphate reductase [Patescibacteria group bacterium]|nr:adenosylcobalamin-dependent ribonucleoside-diphosphate reductase [Patescibacteria group bacterium]
MKINFVKKRDEKIVLFDEIKIENAIYKAAEASGKPEHRLAKNLTHEVLIRLTKKLKPRQVPDIELIQDLVEKVLVEKNESKIAKTYILYREHRAEIRREKEQILNKKEIDEVDKKFDLNALRVLAARYLKKNEKGEIIESPKELFTRVAIHAALPSLLYDLKIFKKHPTKKNKPTTKVKNIPLKKYFENIRTGLKIGPYELNKYHLEGLERLFKRFQERGQTTVSWEKFLDLLKKGYFDKYAEEITSYYNLMASRKFFPNTPAIANFGNVLGLGSACFVLDIEDSMESIMSSLKNAALIFQAGGGVGYNFSKLRPAGDYVRSTSGVASGPLSFMKLFDNMTDTIKQGGIRRGANMGILNSNHPDIEEFITAKKGNGALRNFNISVFLTRDFWDYLKKNKPYPLINPRNGKIIREINPQKLFDAIVYSAWESAEPGVIFDDKINEFNPFFKSLGPIQTTNPCGEVLLYPYESCNLGSINLWNFIKENGRGKNVIDWEELKNTIITASRFLDNVVDINKYPLKSIEEMTLNTRKIGLGIMGLGDLLYDLEIPYSSKNGLAMIEKIMEFVNYYSKIVSINIAKERGPFLYFEKSFYAEGKMPFSGFQDKSSWNFDWKAAAKKAKGGIRNAYTTVVAPTGSLSMIAGCSSGMEPVYSLVFEKNVAVGKFYYVDSAFEHRMQKEGLMDEALLKNATALSGSIQKIPYISEKLKKIFLTALDISPEDHIRALAAVQKWTDSSVSKTNNFPADATPKEVEKVYRLAHELGCKDVTVFRDTSIRDQVLVPGGTKSEKLKITPIKDEKAKGLAVYEEAGFREKAVSLNLSPATGENGETDKEVEKCPNDGTPLVKHEGCKECPTCGWGMCS